jgi:hypothetical protein
MCDQAVTPGNIHDPHARLETLSHDPGFRFIWPAPISTRPLHNLNAAIKSVHAVRHLNLLLKHQNETRSSNSAAEPWKSMGRRRRLRAISLAKSTLVGGYQKQEII